MSTPITETPWTYERSGVDRGEVRASVSALVAAARFRSAPSSGRVIDLPGHYAGLLRIGRETIAITTDTVGTKVLLANREADFEPLGEDLVGISVNDLASVGARPAGLVDVILCARPRPAVFKAIGRGIRRGLERSGGTLLGGETAVVPELVHDVDLGSTAFGFFPRGRAPVTGARIRPGDVVLGLPSNGFHANGYTLVRRLIDTRGVPLDRPRPGGTHSLRSELLAPTRIYSPATEALAELPGVHGFAHISGGGVRNLLRLNDRVKFWLDAWPVPDGLFAWIQELGGLEFEELFQTFNVGIGFVIIAEQRRLAELRRRLARAGFPDALLLGRVERGRGVHLPRWDLVFDEY